MSIINALGKSPGGGLAASLAMKSGLPWFRLRGGITRFFMIRRTFGQDYCKVGASWTFISPAMNSGFPS